MKRILSTLFTALSVVNIHAQTVKQSALPFQAAPALTDAVVGWRPQSGVNPPYNFNLGALNTLFGSNITGLTNAQIISLDWSKVTTGKPTTLAGYGITDAITSAAVAAAYQPIGGDLTALEALTGTNTMYYRSGVSQWSPVVVGTGLTFSGGTLASSAGGGNMNTSIYDPTVRGYVDRAVLSDTATKLATARTINGVAFDGTGNITIADATKEPSISAGTTSQYWRGDKTWQALTIPTQFNPVAGTNITISGVYPNITFNATAGGAQVAANLANSSSTGVTGLLPIANGGTGTLVPALVAGTNITVTGSWPNQTINSTPGLIANEIGFGVDGGGSVITTGLRVKRLVMYACTITGWGIIADQSGSITMDIRKGTPSGGTVTTSTITAAATPALSSQQVTTSSTLTGWTTALAAGDVLELVVTSTPVNVTQATLTIKITR